MWGRRRVWNTLWATEPPWEVGIFVLGREEWARESKGEEEEENGAKGEHMKGTYELMEYPSHDCINCVSLNFIQPHISQ